MTDEVGSGFQEGQQVLVALVLERRTQTVRSALGDLQSRALDELGFGASRSC
jgi:hypothetical protein